MDPFIFLLAGIALAVPLLAKILFQHSICWKEWAAQTGILLFVLLMGFALARTAQITDIRLQNGEVLSKTRETVRCTHSYECRCRGEGKNRECDTCYEHFNDYDWVLHTNVGRLLVDRVDRQGKHEPARYSRASRGDPVAVRERWTNYVKAAPHSVFNTQLSTDDAALVPEYPGDIHDLHYANRVFDLRREGVDTAAWNADLAERLKTVGPQVGGNIIVLLTDRPNRSFAGVIERGWLRGKSNDTVVVVSVQDGRVAWAEAFGWSDTPRLYIELRHGLEGMEATSTALLPAIQTAVLAYYTPMPEDRFSHLGAEIRLSTATYIGLLILALVLSAGTTVWFHTHDPFSPSRPSRRSFRRSL